MPKNKRIVKKLVGDCVGVGEKGKGVIGTLLMEAHGIENGWKEYFSVRLNVDVNRKQNSNIALVRCIGKS